MTHSVYNQEIIDRLRAAIVAFQSGAADLDGVQSSLQSALSLLENDGSGVADLVRRAEADVEEIRFTRLLDEQHPEVVFRLDELLGKLSC